MPKTAADMPIFSTQDHGTATYVRNVTGWAYPLDLTGLAVWNDQANSPVIGGTAITPRHLLFAFHIPPNVGTSFRFVAADNTVVTRTVTAVQNITAAAFPERDVCVGVLDSDLPASIKPFRFMAGDANSYLPTAIGAYMLCIGTNQTNQAVTKRIVIPNASSTRWSIFNAALSPELALTATTVGGDSGHPIFCNIQGEAILVSLWSSAQSGPILHLFLTDIQTAVDSLVSGYSIATKDLSAFTI